MERETILPGADQSYVEQKKVQEYLLNEAHPQGRAKAVFFRAFGFAPDQWEAFTDALCAQGRQGAVVQTVSLPDSTQYAVEGILTAPDGRTPRVRTVWETRPDDPRPRLITAYPAR